MKNNHFYFALAYNNDQLQKALLDFKVELGKVYNVRMDIRVDLDKSASATVYVDGVEYLEMKHTDNGNFKPYKMWSKGKIPIHVSPPFGGEWPENPAVGQIKNLKLKFNPYEVTPPEQWIASPNELTLYDYAGLGGFSMLKDYALSFDFKISKWPTTEQTLIRVGEFPSFLFFRVICAYAKKIQKRFYREFFQMPMGIDHPIEEIVLNIPTRRWHPYHHRIVQRIES